jgi:PAS domain S-box-containing protein
MGRIPRKGIPPCRFASACMETSRNTSDGLSEQYTKATPSIKTDNQSYRLLFENSLDGILIAISDGTICDANPAICAMLQMSKEEICRAGRAGIVENTPSLAAAIEELTRTGKTQCELVFIRKDGTKCIAETNAIVIDGRSESLRSFVIIRDITGRKQAEVLVRANEQKFRAIANYTSDWENWIAPDGRLLWVNSAVEKFTGYTPQEYQNLPDRIRKILPEEDIDHFFDHYERALKHRLSDNDVECRIRHKDGSLRWTSVSYQPIYADNGEFLGIRTSVRDITERKRAEEAVHKSEERFRAIASSTPDHLIVQDHELRYTFVLNPQLGLTEQDMLGKTDYDILAHNDAERITAIKRTVLETGKSIYVESPALAHNGRTEYFEGSYVPRFDAQGQVDGLIGYFRNVTDRKQTEESLRESESRFGGAFEYAAIGMALVSPEGRWLKVNRAVCDLVGYSESELLAKTFQDITHPEDLNADLSYVRQMLAGQIRTYQMEKRYYHKAGHIVWALLSVSLVRDKREKPLYFISQIQNITDSKRAEESLRLSETRYRNLFETESDAIFLLDCATGQILEVNEAAINLYGYSREQLLKLKNTDMSAEPDKTREATSKGYTKVLFRWHRKKDGTVFPVEITGSYFEDQGRKVQVVAVRDITERERTQEQVRIQRKHLNDIIKAANVGTWEWNVQTGDTVFNERWAEIIGYTLEELAPTNIETWRKFAHQDDLKHVEILLQKHFMGEIDYYDCECRMKHKNGSWVWINDRGRVVEWTPDGRPLRMSGTHTDITERKQAEQERQITIEFMRIINTSTSTHELIQATTTFFQQQSGCEAVGVRLKEGDDYPYYEMRGFAQEFVHAENKLCARNDVGDILRDNDGNPVIECMCGNVICGRFDPSKPFFTKRGSFWTNCTTELLASTSEADRQARTRNRCNGEGYESVALIPLYFGTERLGLLQLNDRRKGLFSPETIGLWERLADQLAVALAKFFAEDAMRKSEELKHVILDSVSTHIAVLDAGGTVIAVNKPWQKFAQANGLFEGVAEGVNYLEVCRKAVAAGVDDSLETLRGIEAVLNGERTLFTAEYPCHSPTELRWFLMTVTRLATDDSGVVISHENITERKKTQRAIIDREQELAAIYDNAPFVMMLMDKDRHVYKANKRGTMFIGASGAELSGLRCGDVLCCQNAKDDPRGCGFGLQCEQCEVRRAITETCETGRSYNMMEATLSSVIEGKKQDLTVLVSSTRLLIREQNRALVTIQDITDRKRAEKELRWKTAFLAAQVESSLDGILVVDSNGKRILINKRLINFFNAPQEILNQSDDEALLRHVYGKVKNPEQFLTKVRYLDSHPHETSRDEIEFKDGTVFDRYSSGVFDEHGKCYGRIWTFRDITERKHAEESLKESEERYRRLFTSMGEGFALCELMYDAAGRPVDYRHIMVNPAFSMLTNLPMDQAESQTMRQMLPDLEMFWIETYGRVVETGIPERIEHYVASLKKHYEAYAWKAGPQRFAVVFADITEHVESQQRALHYQKELAHASRLSAIGEMGSNLAHELNQPFCAILTHAEGALRMLRSATHDNDKLAEKMDTIAKQAERAGIIINRIKNFAKKDTSKTESININRIIQNVVELVTTETKRLRIKVCLDLDKKLPPAKADAIQIEQVLLNLVKNGIEAMEDSQIHQKVLSITSRTTATAIEVLVCDGGKGISPENVGQVFDSFFTTKPYGLGIGLSISRSIIESHGGKIYVAPNLDNGVTFCFNLPLTQ